MPHSMTYDVIIDGSMLHSWQFCPEIVNWSNLSVQILTEFRNLQISFNYQSALIVCLLITSFPGRKEMFIQKD